MPGYFNNQHRPTLGEKVTASARIIKTHDPIITSDTLTSLIFKPGRRTPHRTEWVRQPATVEGVFMGYRTVANGKTGWDGDPDVDGGWVFKESKRFEAWLIVTDPRRKPIYVLPEDVIGVGTLFPDDWRYFKHNSGKGYGSMRVVSRNGDIAYSTDVQAYFSDTYWTEIAYPEHVELTNAAECGEWEGTA